MTKAVLGVEDLLRVVSARRRRRRHGLISGGHALSHDATQVCREILYTVIEHRGEARDAAQVALVLILIGLDVEYSFVDVRRTTPKSQRRCHIRAHQGAKHVAVGLQYASCYVKLKLANTTLHCATFSERELTFTFATCYRPSASVVCLSYVTFVPLRPTQAVQIFGNISTALGTLAIH